VAEAELAQAQSRLDRLAAESRRQDDIRAALAEQEDPEEAVAAAKAAADKAASALATLREDLARQQARKEELAAARDEAGAALASAKAELTGIEREYNALLRDREARARQAANKHGLPAALDKVRAAPGYERALAAVLGRDAKAPLGQPDSTVEGRFWTGSGVPAPVADCLAAHVPDCPAELAARLALVHVADADDGRTLNPGEWLVTRDGKLRRWDGFVARGEGAAEAARLEAENRFGELERELPGKRAAVEGATARQESAQAELGELQRALIAAERDIAAAADSERAALRALDQAEAARERLATRLAELDASAADLGEQREQAETELKAAQDRRAALPDPEHGRAGLAAAQARHEAARATLQAATAELASHDQALAVARERTAARAADMKGWQARSDEATRRLSEMARRFGEIEEERAVVAAKPAALMRDIEQGDAVRERLGKELAAAEAALAEADSAARAVDARLADANEQLASARETRAGASARAENEEGRRSEMARISGERFQCPPPLLCARFEFEEDDIADSSKEGESLEGLTASRERIGPVNLVAADELAALETQHGESTAEQAELAEAVHRLRGSIGSLNREGRERLRAAFEEVDTHFRRLFTRLFEGGQAHLALIDSDDPLEAGLEIFAQPPGKRLQSLSLLSGGEQALTAVALIFALFLTNPAPICVLDEVDAPLDDANIDRFCDLLDAMNRETDTRYLIVTHNAVTMSRMNRLFGVTMVERGVSRLVSVDLGGAEELLAAE
ncbi:MAG: chromosome segregation protein, partial [Novosphingobium sp.]|nr:chromosome segregation protein [Novosphingobium sp.]